jgi:hypothetical protein
LGGGGNVSGTVTQRSVAVPVFSPLVGLALTAVGALSLLFYLVFSAYAPDYAGEGDARTNALSRSAVGFAGLVSFLRLQGVPVLLSRGLESEEYERASLVILTPSLDNTGAEIQAVTDLEPKLIILPKWLAAPDPVQRGWVRNSGLLRADAIAERLLRSESQSSAVSQAAGAVPVTLHNGFGGTEATPAPIESLQTISGDDWIGYVTDQANRLIVARLEGTETYVLSDPDLMNTHGLSDLATARAAAAIIQDIRAGDGPVVFDLTLSGYRRSPNLLRLAFEPPLLGATLCALLAALLMGVHASVRFGAPLEGRRTLALGKQALADNSAALINMVGREHRIAPRYAAAIRRRVARIVGVPHDTRDEELNELLDRLRRRNDTAQPIAKLMAEARDARDASDALRVARKLHRWRRSMIHEP